jgi:hypothetical protein
MSDLSIVAAVLTSTVGLAGALVAGLSVYLSYKGRHNLLRQVVYGRQMDAYFAIAEAMTSLYTAAQNVLVPGSPRPGGEDAGGRLRAALREEHERFTGAVNRSLIVLPSKVKAAVDHFNETLLAAGAPAEGAQIGRPSVAGTRPPDPAQELAEAYDRAVNSIRHHLAIDSLTTGMLKEMGIGSESVTLKSVRRGVSPLVPVGRGARRGD